MKFNLVLSTFSLLGACSLAGANLTVLNTNDSGEGSLRAVLQTANSNGEADTITFAESLRGQTITLTSDELTISSEVTLTGFPEELTISGDQARRVFLVTESAEASLSGLVISDGVANRGGGINNAGTLTVDSCLFRNHSGSVGSGIENAGAITVTNSRFEDNFATDDGAGFNNCFPGVGQIDGCTFSGNTIPNNGAAVSNFFTLTITNSTFFDNSAVNEDDDGTGDIPTRNGGAIFNNNNMTLVNCSLFDNVSGNSGGAIYHRGQSLTLINCTLSGNESPRGAAISSRSGVTLIQTTIANNTSSEGGGGLFFQDFGNFRLSNSIVANNSEPQILLADNLNSQSFFLFPGGRNIFSDDSITTVPNFSNPFSFITNTDPLLGSLADNGGPVQTLALLPGSPAIDAGFNFEAVDASFEPLATDARGAQRIVQTLSETGEAIVDLGSYEAIPSDQDGDGDGVPDESDAFPEDPSEDTDDDNDGLGNDDDPNPDEPNMSPSGGGELVVNGSFEDTAVNPTRFVQLRADQVPAWNSNGNALEFWADGFLGFDSFDGNQFAELNGLYWQQTIAATPGTTVQWSFYHRGRRGTDTVNLSIGEPGSEEVVGTFSTSNDDWVRYEGLYQVPSGQTETSILFTPERLGRQGRADNLLDLVSVIEVAADFDGDGVPDAQDAFPNDPNESQDSDGDTFGDNFDPAPNDPTIPNLGVEFIVNGSFEDTAETPRTFVQLRANEVPGWESNGNSLEFWANGFRGVESLDGNQFAELNALNWFQSFETRPGMTLLWSFYHRGRNTTDTVTLSIGAPGSEVEIASFSTSPERWVRYEGTYEVPSGQDVTSIHFDPRGGGRSSNFLDFVSVGEVIVTP